jgi:hypothetical protein
MNFDFIIDKFFKTKLVKGYPECPDCPDEDDDCEDPCGCDCQDGGPCGGGCGGGGGGGPLGRVMSIEEEVGEFLAVGQLAPMENDGITYCPTPAPPKCKDCEVSGGTHDSPGQGVCIQVTNEY